MIVIVDIVFLMRVVKGWLFSYTLGRWWVGCLMGPIVGWLWWGLLVGCWWVASNDCWLLPLVCLLMDSTDDGDWLNTRGWITPLAYTRHVCLYVIGYPSFSTMSVCQGTRLSVGSLQWWRKQNKTNNRNRVFTRNGQHTWRNVMHLLAVALRR